MDIRYVFMLCLTFFLAFTYAQLDEVARMFRSENSKKIYCGKHLSQTLSTVCKGNYNTLTKKADIYDGGFWSAQYTSDMQSDINYPFRSKARATSLISSNFRRRKRRGVFNECCEKPCSHEELSSYCGNRKK